MKSHVISFALLTRLSQPRISHIATLGILVRANTL